MTTCTVRHVAGSQAERDCPVHGHAQATQRAAALAVSPPTPAAQVLREKAITIATSNADDAAYLALQDVADLTSGLEDVRIVGGHMVSLLLTAFPVEGVPIRRTLDTDVAISAAIAGSGNVHDVLTSAGYAPSGGNRYTRSAGVDGEPALEVDVLVPSDLQDFKTVWHGGRGFDAVPGLSLALAAQPIFIGVDVTLTNESVREFEVRVPPVEHATVLKAYATTTRTEPKDYADLYSLLSIAFAYQNSLDRIGGWKMSGTPTGARKDAAVLLRNIADRAPRSGLLEHAHVPPDRFVALVRSLVADPR